MHDTGRYAAELRRRLSWALSESGRSKAAVEATAGLAGGALSQLTARGCRRVNVAQLASLASVLSVRLPWLLLGYGPAWWAAERVSPGPDGSSLAERLPERFLALQDAKAAAGRGGRVVRVRPW